LPLIGTAGHVDHGKSTLVEALTGRDPDRWEEEKRRGLTIDLGFAWTTLEGAGEVSFVDVPGHERFLKNMLAGIEAIDVALFVVAADEGWMPQSEEHLAVLDLLGIGRGVVALTKVDAVDEETVDLATLEVGEQLAGTSLADAEVIPVSARTGIGLESLRRVLGELTVGLEPDGDRPRLWVDRAFTVAGVGTVVTGTLLGGRIREGETVEVLPSHRTARVRGMQSHEAELDLARPGRRLALNLSGVERAEVPRGSMLGYPGQWLLTNRFTARVRLARYVDDLPARGAFHLHFGSAVHPVTIKGRDGDHLLLQVATPLPMGAGDRFIIRDAGRRLVVAGGMVLDPSPGPPPMALATAAMIDPLASPDRIATDLLSIRGDDDLARLAAHSGGGHPLEAITVGGRALTRSRFTSLLQQVEEAVTAHHTEHPLRPGIPLATLATSLEIPSDLAERLVAESPTMDRVGPDVALVDHESGLDEESTQLWSDVERRLRADLSVPSATDLGLDPELLHLLVRMGKLVRISKDLVYLPEQVDRIVSELRAMEGSFTVAQFRDRTGLSRKYAVPLLEWADKEGLTVRQGDERRLR
jgi:selenocysteine-specific elongation factor